MADQLLARLAEVNSLLSARGPYEYLVDEPIPELNRLPKPVGKRTFKVGSLFRRQKREILQFNKPIGENLLVKYGLTPMSPHDPMILRDAMNLLRIDILDDLIKKDRYVLKHSGKTAVLEHAADPKFHVSLLWFDSGKNLVDSQDFEDLDEAVAVIWSFLPDNVRQNYAERSVPKL